MSSTHTTSEPPGDDSNVEIVPEIVEWLVGGLVALAGLGMTLGGSGVLWASDEALFAEAIAEAVAESPPEPDVLTTAQMTEIATTTAFWIGVGLVFTGLATIAVAIVYVVGRYRSRRKVGPRNSREQLFSDGLLGAVATGLLTFVPGSPILGGGVSGYLHRKRGGSAAKAGAVSGLLAASPFVVLLLFVAVGLFIGFSGAGVGLGVVVAIAVVIAIIGTVLYSVGLGALGGYLADVIATDDPAYEDPTEPIKEENSSR